MVKKGLGKGLQALIPPTVVINETETNGESIILVPIERIKPNPDQPRKTFDLDKIRELSESIKEHGVLQPIVVRMIASGRYEIVVGERRWKASQLAGLVEMPCILRDLDQKSVTELALIENIQREDLNGVEEAEGYRHLMDDFNYTQEALASRLGKSRPHIANTMRLLSLAPPILEFVRNGRLSPGHARAILAVNEKDLHLSFAERIIAENFSVRQSEEAARLINEGKQTDGDSAISKKNKNQEAIVFRLSPILRDMEDRLRSSLGTKVKLRPSEKGGRIEIDFYSDDELTRIVDIISQENS